MQPVLAYASCKHTKVAGFRSCACNGKGGKFGYYDHTRAKKIEAVTKEKICRCFPVRVPAKRLEPVVWEAVREFLVDPKIATELLRLAKRQTGKDRPAVQVEAKLKALANQIGVLADRIASLPREVEPKPLYDRLAALQSEQEVMQKTIEARKQLFVDEPLDYADFEKFRGQVAELLRHENDPNVKTKIIELLVEKVLVKEKGIEIYFHVGSLHFKRELGLVPGSRPFLCPKSEEGTVLPFRARKWARGRNRVESSSTTLTQPQPHLRNVTGQRESANQENLVHHKTCGSPSRASNDLRPIPQ